MVALLVLGSAILLISCRKNVGVEKLSGKEKLMTDMSDSLVQIESEGGVVKLRFETPLLERYQFAREPYMEFRKGVDVKTFDTLGNVETSIVAKYAIMYEKKQLWEAKGDVVVTNAKGHTLETQQLFWNQKIKKIYSNIDSKITQGQDVLYGVGFESDEAFKEWEFSKPRGRLAVEVDENEGGSREAGVEKDNSTGGQTTAKELNRGADSKRDAGQVQGGDSLTNRRTVNRMDIGERGTQNKPEQKKPPRKPEEEIANFELPEVARDRNRAMEEVVIDESIPQEITEIEAVN